jgi:hypothetical protein
MANEVSSNNPVETDARRLANEAMALAKQALSEIPDAARDKLALEIANAAYNFYKNTVSSGTPPGAAAAQSKQQTNVLITDVAKRQGVTAHLPTDDPSTPEDEGAVNNEDVQRALDVYRKGVTDSGVPIEEILAKDPNADRVRPQDVGPVTPAREVADLTPAQRLQAELQRQTTVADTNTKDLEATARGQGAVAERAAAQLRLSAQREDQAAQGLVQQARGAERKGARLEAILQRGQRQLQVADTVAAQTAQTQLAAQDKLADLDARRKELQAQLDSARAANDQAAVNDLQKKMADLDLETQKANATIQGQNADRTLDSDKTNATIAGQNQDRALKAQESDDAHWVRVEDMKLKAREQQQKAAQGLLDAEQTEVLRQQWQQQYDLAVKQFEEAKRQNKSQEDLARHQANVQFWGGLISSLVGGATAVGAGMVTKSDRRAKEDVRKVSTSDLSDLADAVARSVATFRYKNGEGDPGEKAGVMAQDLEGTRLGEAVVSEGNDGMKRVDYGTLATLLAAAVVKARKRAA